MFKKTVSNPPGSYPDSLCDEEGNQARGWGGVRKDSVSSISNSDREMSYG